jgi:4-amino-4-deoxy-L-arabinose transferase-like glycosyltransferase
MHLPKKQLPFWLITLAVLIGLPGYTLIQDGMFMDAMLYTSVAHNEAQGIGSFWFPRFSKLDLNIPGIHSFHEQPPLVFGIQSVFFRIFGHSMYVERFYVFFTTCITALLIHLLWRNVFKSREDLKKLSWLPIFLWITIPTIFWGASNNVNENTMGIFTLASVLCAFIALQKESGFGLWFWLSSGIFIFLATMSKGFPGFFPLCVPLLYWLVTRKISFKKALICTIILLLIPVLIYGVLFQIEPSRESLSIYLFKRAFQRIAEAPTTSNRFQSLESLFMDLLPAIGLLLIFFIIARWKKVKYYAIADRKSILFFMLLGLAASAPLMLTMVQKAFYLIPCYPFFAIGFAMLMAPFVIHIQARQNPESKGFKIFRGIGILLLIGSVAVAAMMKGKTGRDQDILHDTRILGKMIPHYTTVTITSSAFYIDWELQCYLMRYYNISCDFKPQQPNEYMILDRTEKPAVDMSLYRKMDLNLERYDLYKLK